MKTSLRWHLHHRLVALLQLAAAAKRKDGEGDVDEEMVVERA